MVESTNIVMPLRELESARAISRTKFVNWVIFIQNASDPKVPSNRGELGFKLTASGEGVAAAGRADRCGETGIGNADQFRCRQTGPLIEWPDARERTDKVQTLVERSPWRWNLLTPAHDLRSLLIDALVPG